MGVFSNPYKSQPAQAWWSTSVADIPSELVDPVGAIPFTIGGGDKIATAGSCFAQHIARTLVRLNFNYLVTEQGPAEKNYGVFPARFANIYSVRQLLQLFDRAYGLFDPLDSAWRHKSGSYVDPFRPQIEDGGFASVAALEADRTAHLAAVRRMFEDSDVFVFTLGLTEAWRSKVDGAVFPAAPGVSGSPEADHGYEFHNFSVEEMVADLREFIEKFRVVRPDVRIILTVSPVPLIATYENRHVLVSTVASKSALRVVADVVSRLPGVAYFPSYEIVTGPQAGNRYFEPDLRTVSPEGVDHVMGIFARHYLHADAERPAPVVAAPRLAPAQRAADEALDEAYRVVCEEEAIAQ